MGNINLTAFYVTNIGNIKVAQNRYVVSVPRHSKAFKK